MDIPNFLHALQRVILHRGPSVALLALLLAALPAQAQNPAPCDDALVRAEANYFEGRFDEATELLNDCLSGGAFSGTEEEQAYSLLSKVYSAKGLEAQAREAVRELLTRVPNYRPNPVTETPEFIDLVEEVRRTMEPPEPDVAEGPDPAPTDSVLVPTDSLVMREPVAADSTEAVEVAEEAPPPDPIPEQARPKKRSGLTKWLAIGGGALAAGVAVLVLAGGGGDDGPAGTPLPPPPAFPGQ